MADPAARIDMRRVVGRRDIVWITLDTLRYDAAQRCFAAGELPVLSRHLPTDGWERRHTPGSFTFAAHQAFFAGFLPTPAHPGPHRRDLALAFPGSETIDDATCVLDAAGSVVEGLALRGYRTVCIGGTGFFNPASPLGRVLPGLFEEAHWRPEFGVTDADSTRRQVAFAIERLDAPDLRERRVFLFFNVSAIHQPNRHHLPGATEDDLASHRAALRYVDAALAPLFDVLGRRGACVSVFSDHGTAYGEDGYHGHRHAHEVVMTVPYAEFLLP